MQVERKIEGYFNPSDVAFQVDSLRNAIRLTFVTDDVFKRSDEFEMTSQEALALAVELIKAVQRNGV